MRFVIFGAGAIGGVVGARLAQAGRDVVLIARGAHYDAIREHGLRIEDPVQRAVLSIDVVPSPGAVPWTDEDVVMLTTKSQDSDAALHALQDAAPPATPVFCLQNGVENERLALRRFEQVYGAAVMVPAAHLEPGIVLAYGTVRTGMIDIGRYPTGVDQRCEQVAQALQQARFSSEPSPDVMRLKYSKLVLNLANAINAICQPGPAAEQLGDRAKEEGRAALTAAGIEFEAADVAGIAARWKRWGVRDIAGHERAGSSTWQSLARGSGAIETDYLNGEIALLGRLHGVPTPVNELLCRVANRAAREGWKPAGVEPEALLERLTAGQTVPR